jgi:hypothetical protein
VGLSERGPEPRRCGHASSFLDQGLVRNGLDAARNRPAPPRTSPWPRSTATRDSSGWPVAWAPSGRATKAGVTTLAFLIAEIRRVQSPIPEGEDTALRLPWSGVHGSIASLRNRTVMHIVDFGASMDVDIPYTAPGPGAILPPRRAPNRN